MRPARYRKKPVEIEAILFRGDEDSAYVICEWSGATKETRDNGDGTTRLVLVIDTLEGKMIADPGDWVIKGVVGEFYPCKPDVFEKSYQAY